jgi:hypothetical protein
VNDVAVVGSQEKGPSQGVGARRCHQDMGEKCERESVNDELEYIKTPSGKPHTAKST